MCLVILKIKIKIKIKDKNGHKIWDLKESSTNTVYVFDTEISWVKRKEKEYKVSRESFSIESS